MASSAGGPPGSRAASSSGSRSAVCLRPCPVSSSGRADREPGPGRDRRLLRTACRDQVPGRHVDRPRRAPRRPGLALADLVLALDGEGRPIDLGRPDEVLVRSGVRMRREGIWLPERSSWPGPVGLPANPTGPTLIEAHGLRFGYDHTDPILRDIDLVAGRAERIALVGPNGSGKSTLGRLLVGLLRPDHGTVLLGADDPSRLPPAELARRAGYVFQDPETQFLTNTVADEVMLGLRPDERAASGALMDRLGLPLAEFGTRSPYLLSGGEARRLSLACVLVRWPQVLVLDEPTFGQDRHGHEALVEIIRERLDTGICLFAATPRSALRRARRGPDHRARRGLDRGRPPRDEGGLMISAPTCRRPSSTARSGARARSSSWRWRSSGWWRSRSRSSRCPRSRSRSSPSAPACGWAGSRSGTWHERSPAVAGGPRHRPVQHPVLTGESRSSCGRADHDRAVPDHRARADERRQLSLRVVAIATVGAVFALTTDSTKLVDSLVQQARVPERFAYGTLAAYQAIPRFAEDLATLRQARRIRGLRGGWHPRLLGEPPRVGDPPWGPQGTRHGRTGLRFGAALGVPGRGVGPVRRVDRARRRLRRWAVLVIGR